MLFLSFILLYPVPVTRYLLSVGRYPYSSPRAMHQRQYPVCDPIRVTRESTLIFEDVNNNDVAELLFVAL